MLRTTLIGLGCLLSLAAPSWAQQATHTLTAQLDAGALSISDVTGATTTLSGPWQTLTGAAVSNQPATPSNAPQFLVLNPAANPDWQIQMTLSAPTPALGPTVRYVGGAGTISNNRLGIPSTDQVRTVQSGVATAQLMALTVTQFTGQPPAVGNFRYTLGSTNANWNISYPATQLPGTYHYTLTATVIGY